MNEKEIRVNFLRGITSEDQAENDLYRIGMSDMQVSKRLSDWNHMKVSVAEPFEDYAKRMGEMK